MCGTMYFIMFLPTFCLCGYGSKGSYILTFIVFQLVFFMFSMYVSIVKVTCS